MLPAIETRNIQLETSSNQLRIKPLGAWQTVLAFGLPTLMMVISFHWFMPWLQTIGLTPFESIVVAHTVPMGFLITAALVMYHEVDGYPLTWQAFSKRFRIPRISLKAVLQGLGLFIIMNLGYGIFNMVSAGFIAEGSLPIPENLPALLDPTVSLTSAVLDIMVGGQIMGNWGVVILYVVMLTFIIVGEELWWRGYILPRQEAAHGRFTWILHGLLWAAFHIFKWWDLIGLLPVCLALAYVSQRTKNNWPAIIAHYLFNGLALIFIIQAVVMTIGS